MSAIIGSRAEVKKLTDLVLSAYTVEDMESFLLSLQKNILNQKIRYPMLEFAGKEFYKSIPIDRQIAITNRISQLPESGRFVLLGIMLQIRLTDHFEESIKKAGDYIIEGGNWLACDTIGERVMGFALLTVPEKTIPVLRKLAASENNWLVRSVGVATHYAVKKGLKKAFVADMFELLLSCAYTTDFHTKKGIGWGAKTIAKFHPEIVARYQERIEADAGIRQWFRTKIKIGLGRSYKYATRYTG